MSVKQAKVKVGTVLHPDLIRRARKVAAEEDKTISTVIEEALREYLNRRDSGGSSVEMTRGLFKLSRRDLESVLDEDLCES